MNYLYLTRNLIVIIFYIGFFIWFLIKKQKLEEAEKEIENLKQENEVLKQMKKLDGSYVGSYVYAEEYDTKKIGNIHIFFTAFNKFDCKEKYQKLHCFNSIIYPKKFKRYEKKIILTFNVSEDFSKLCSYLEKTKNKYWYINANLKCLEHNLDNLCVNSFKITKNKEIIIEFIPDRYLKNKEIK